MIKNKKGFTLIELIIVMSIIGIMAIVAVVAIGSKSADARDARRLWDAQQIHRAFALHATENPNDFLEGPAQPNILLHQFNNASDIAYLLTLDNVQDPDDSRTTTCSTGMNGNVCDQTGGYTVFNLVLGGDQTHYGTFSNYAIGMKLESIETTASVEWHKFVGIKNVYAATCGDLMCEPPDEDSDNCWLDCGCGNGFCNSEVGEDLGSCPEDCAVCGDGACTLVAGEDYNSCLADCPASCGNGLCEEIYGETAANCEEDCATICGDGICQEVMGETPLNCPDDCGEGGGGEEVGDVDNNDWLYIDQNGIQRLPAVEGGGGGEIPMGS